MHYIETILLKKRWRTDALWTRASLSWKWSRRIPLFLDTHALLHSQYWPREKLDELSRERIASIIHDAKAVPFWHTVFERVNVKPDSFSPGDFRKLPIITKKDLVVEDYARITNERFVSRSYWDRSSGSTGQPFAFLVDPGYILRTLAFHEREYITAGRGTRHPILAVRGRRAPGFDFPDYEFFFVRGYNAMRHRFDDFIERAASYRDGFFLHGFVTPLMELARLVRERDRTLPIRGIMAAGETLSPAARRTMEEAFNAEVFVRYGSNELGRIAFECEKHRIHINEESLLLEIFDTEGNQVTSGKEGRGVATPYDHRVMPFIRYFTGDLGVIDADPCSCGRTLKTIQIKGRESHLIEVVNGRVVPLLELSTAFDRFFDAIYQYQIVQKSPQIFLIRVVPGPGFEKKKDRLEMTIKQVLGSDIRVEWGMEDHIEHGLDGKAIYFIRASDESL